jgi:hypothetical protein
MVRHLFGPSLCFSLRSLRSAFICIDWVFKKKYTTSQDVTTYCKNSMLQFLTINEINVCLH